MITILGIKLSYDTLVSLVCFVLFLWSEYLGGNAKIKENNVTSFLYRYLRIQRKEDDKLNRIIDILKEK